MSLSSPYAAFLVCEIRLFLPNQISLESRTCLERLSIYGSPQQTPGAHRAFGSIVSHLDLFQQRPRWERSQAWFSLQNTIEACVISLSGVCFSFRNLQVSRFLAFVRLLLGGLDPSITIYSFSLFVKRENFPIKLDFFRK